MNLSLPRINFSAVSDQNRRDKGLKENKSELSNSEEAESVTETKCIQTGMKHTALGSDLFPPLD